MYGYSWLSKGNCSYARQELELSSSSFGSGGSRRGENRYDIVDISRFLRQGGRSTVMPMVRALLNLASGGATHTQSQQPGASSAESQPPVKASDETAATTTAANETPYSSSGCHAARLPHRSPHHARQLQQQEPSKHQRATKAAEAGGALVSVNDVGGRAAPSSSKRPRPPGHQQQQQHPPQQQQEAPPPPPPKQHRKDFSRAFFLSHLSAANDAKLVAAWGSLGLTQKLGPADIAAHAAEAGASVIDFFVNAAARADAAPPHLWARSAGLRSVAYRLVRRMREQNKTNIDNLAIRPSSRSLVCEEFGSWYQGVRSSEGKGGWSKRKDWPQALWVLWVFGHLVYQAALAMRKKEALPGMDETPY